MNGHTSWSVRLSLREKWRERPSIWRATVQVHRGTKREGMASPTYEKRTNEIWRVRAGAPYALVWSVRDDRVRIWACYYMREFLRVRKTDVHAETSRWTHTSGSKPGRADRSGQSASAQSLFKVRLTLSTVPEKKSMPVFPGTWESMSFFLFVSLSLYVRSHQSTTSAVVSRPENSWSLKSISGQVVPFLIHGQDFSTYKFPKVASMNRDPESLAFFPSSSWRVLNGRYLDIVHFRSKSIHFANFHSISLFMPWYSVIEIRNCTVVVIVWQCKIGWRANRECPRM